LTPRPKIRGGPLCPPSATDKSGSDFGLVPYDDRAVALRVALPPGKRMQSETIADNMNTYALESADGDSFAISREIDKPIVALTIPGNDRREWAIDRGLEPLASCMSSNHAAMSRFDLTPLPCTILPPMGSQDKIPHRHPTGYIAKGYFRPTG